MSVALQTSLLAGLGIGSVYALVGLAYSFIFRMTGTFNFAMGVMVTYGALLAVSLYMRASLPAVLALILAALIVGGIGVINERVAIWPLTRSGSNHGDAWLISTLGFGLLIGGVAQRIWGPQALGVDNFLPSPTFRVGEAQLSSTYLMAMIAVIAAYLGVAAFERFTHWGLVMKAVAQNSHAVELTGVNTMRLGVVAFAFGGMIAGFAGFMASPVTFADPSAGFTFSLLAFAGLAIGGFMSHWGALLGGLLVGLAQSLSATYIGQGYQNLMVLAMLTAVLLVKPNGLLSPRGRVV